MSERLYERYKDALRRGHVAALRGRLDAALVAYGEAADIAPERALPHASIGTVLNRLGRPTEALAAFGMALDRAPADEGALAGRADVLAATGRRVEAADTLDRLAEIQERAGRLPEACDTARRALELAESKDRRRHVEGLAARLRETPADEQAAAALERALGFLEPPAAEGAAPGVDGSILAEDGEERLDQGDARGARERLLAAVAAHRAAGAIDAALDASYLALAIAPADAELHLQLAGLYLDRGWSDPAVEKLLLLDRLASLGDEADVRRRICALAAERLPDDPRLAALCA